MWVSLSITTFILFTLFILLPYACLFFQTIHACSSLGFILPSTWNILTQDIQSLASFTAFKFCIIFNCLVGPFPSPIYLKFLPYHAISFLPWFIFLYGAFCLLTYKMYWVCLRSSPWLEYKLCIGGVLFGLFFFFNQHYIAYVWNTVSCWYVSYGCTGSKNQKDPCTWGLMLCSYYLKM